MGDSRRHAIKQTSDLNQIEVMGPRCQHLSCSFVAVSLFPQRQCSDTISVVERLGARAALERGTGSSGQPLPAGRASGCTPRDSMDKGLFEESGDRAQVWRHRVIQVLLLLG